MSLKNCSGKVKAAAYCRVSTDRDEQAGSLASQRLYFEEYIKCHEELEFSGVYYDEGISGTQTQKRQGFIRMIEDALNHRIDLILTKEVSLMENCGSPSWQALLRKRAERPRNV